MDFSRLQTWLFVPAVRPERFTKALNSGTDVVIIDLEDAVSPEEKTAARSQLEEWLRGSDAAPVLVRINGVGTPWFADDLAVCRFPSVCGIVLPKAETVDDIHLAGKATEKPVLPIVESALGVANLPAIASCPFVFRLLFGKLDLAVDLGMDYPPPDGEDPEETAFLYARSQMVLASRCAGLPPPVDGVFTALEDGVGLERYARRGARLGFGGMLVVHPRQIDGVRRGYMPAPAQIAWAEKILLAASTSAGAATTVDGAMVDAPVIARAKRVMERAGFTSS